MPTPSGRTRISLPFIARCRPIARPSMGAIPRLCWRPKAISSAFSTVGRDRPGRRRHPLPLRPGHPAWRVSRRRRIGDAARRPAQRVMRDLGTGLALVLVIEGILYALFPEGMKQLAQRAMQVPPQVLRASGLLAASIGVVIVWLLRS